MLSIEKEEHIANQINSYRIEILKLISNLLETNTDFITCHCEEMKCNECKIGQELEKLNSIHCWTNYKQFKR